MFLVIGGLAFLSHYYTLDGIKSKTVALSAIINWYEVIALICACDHCYYLFEAPELPEQCPDCGKQATRTQREAEPVMA